MYMDRMKYLREVAELTQKELAEALGLKPATYNRYECGVNEPDISTLIEIADFFRVSLDYLTDHKPNVKSSPELSRFILTGDYTIFGAAPSHEERKRLAAFLSLYYSPYAEKSRGIMSL